MNVEMCLLESNRTHLLQLAKGHVCAKNAKLPVSFLSPKNVCCKQG